MSALALLVTASLFWPALAGVESDKRVALVVGNGAYERAPKLDNAAFDAKAAADALRKLGFEVVEGYDLDIARMRAKVSEFAAALPDAKSAVIYYAGHGISVDDENYLIPTDISLKSPTDLDLGAISVSLLLRQMKREDRVNIVILDACRDNPFAAALARNKTRAVVGERGLSRIEGDLARGTLIAFASDPKSVALDGAPGRHSPFTEAFLDHVFDPGVSIDTVMSRVRAEVWEKTGHNQLPWVNTSLIGDYDLNPQAAPEAPAPANAAGEKPSQEDLLWESAQHSNLSADYQAYLDAYPNGVFAQMAKNRIAALENAVPTRAAIAPSAAPAQAPAAGDWKSEIGTVDMEKALDLRPAVQKEIQQRLAALGLYKGPPTGALDSATRAAIEQWQQSRGATPTSFLGPQQLAALRAETGSAYQKSIAAAPAAKPAPVRAVRRLEKPVAPAVRESAKPPVRREVRRPSPPRQATAATTPSAAPVCSGNPIWCRHAG
ncbi:MAG: caspase family protein, partial [Hyphomicrobiales bacterium]|nr:caspase family protein [Hyphomicrobiales bacterium]